ncbi:Utp14 protein-domain-containing protein [Pseudomassariella vexata]|uniref:Utp14 protein-domain-containing protein n=1 Tax=Pseudomassariella vexata TaxID=1141098 RepID=A0A1Y2DPV3_9PEZI|nr:Utp14 protein-domain-containing protein [Pseudomassariella vexata]ORY61321.1 Utp14 protein-domain-containing protein [Pseudomassariella vexata]
MSGRQSHGRPLLGGPSANAKRKQQTSKAKSNKKALNAFAIASEEYQEKPKRTPRQRELETDLSGGKRPRAGDVDDDEDDEDGGNEGPPRKMRRGAKDDSDVEYGSDSSGNEWKVGVDDDDDSEIESDDAFGDSDEERFEGYTFGGSRKKATKGGEDSEDEADGASLGSDAIDLAAALDLSMSEDEPDAAGDKDSEDSDSESDDGASSSESSDDDMEDGEDVSGMKDWVKKFAGVDDEDEEVQLATAPKAKIGLKDLGLLGIKDPQLKKSLKLMSKEEKSSKPQKLDVPLARRQQARLDRSAAYDSTNKTLDRWTETVKQNRRADHLVFPLAQTETGLARHDNTEIQPLNRQAAGSELERTIMSIMEESGLGPSAEKAAENPLDDGEEQALSRKLLQQQKRRERELKSREDARAKRIKKIKSKAYHRVHRKQRERDELKEHEARAAAGEIDSDEERETQDRQRAMERMGARHRESKWAKMSNKGGRAAWDDDVRVGIADMARRDEELRRRIEGRAANDGSDDDDSDFSGDSDDVDDRKRLLKKLQGVERPEDDTSGSKLMNMAFMKKAEAAKKKANDDMVAQIRKELGSHDEIVNNSESEAEEIGRRSFGVSAIQRDGASAVEKKVRANRKSLASLDTPSESKTEQPDFTEPAPNPSAGAWAAPSASTAGPRRKQRKEKTDSSADVLDLDAGLAVITQAKSSEPKPKSKSKSGTQKAVALADDISDDEDSHMPIQFHDQKLLEKAFGGLDAIAEFEQEKRQIEEEDDEKVIDNTLPGWGSWVGEGVSAREKKRNQGKFLTTKEGTKPKDRKDARLQHVIINEKRIKKNSKYLASQLPYIYENTVQYERALRLPVGPEWVTKDTFQNATKPRVIMKQGIIKPMEKPMH